MAIRICPECGGKCTTTRNDCIHCGYIFDDNKKKCPECGELIDSKLTQCPVCGYEFEHQDTELNRMKDEAVSVDEGFQAKINLIETEQIVIGDDDTKSKTQTTPSIDNTGDDSVIHSRGITKEPFDEKKEAVNSELMSELGEQRKKVINDNTRINDNDNSHSNDLSVKNSAYLFHKTISADEFKRSLFVALVSKNDSPSDIVNSLVEINECISEVYFGEYDVQTSVTCSVGYDRKEEYYEQVYKHLMQGQEYSLHGHPMTASKSGSTLVDVKKTRIVTDWTPFNSSESGIYSSFSFSNGTPVGDFSRVLSKVKSDDYEEIKFPANYSKEAVRGIQHFCEIQSEFSMKLPGDRQKDKKYNNISKQLSLAYYKGPSYEAKLHYNGKEYNYFSFAYGKAKPIIADYPKETEDLIAFADNANKKQEVFVKWWKTITFLMILLSFGLLFVPFCWLWPFTLIFIVLGIVFEIKKNKKHASFLKNAKNESNKIKKNNLKRMLEDNKLKALTAEEESIFDKENDSVETSKKLRKAFGIANVFYCLLFIVLLIVSLIVNNVSKKSSKNVYIDIIDKTVEIESLTSYSTTNNNENIILTFQIYNTKLGMTNISFTIFVNYRNQQIGTISASFSHMNISANTKKNFTSKIPYSDSTTYEYLKNYELSDFVFNYELQYVTFINGDVSTGGSISTNNLNKNINEALPSITSVFESTKYVININNQANGVAISGITSGNQYDFDSQIALTATNIPSGCTIKWTRSDDVVYYGENYTFKVPAGNITITTTICFYTREGNKIYFGTYPQTNVTATTDNGLLSITFDSSTWTSYRYYESSSQSDFMYYKDVDIDNNGTYDYRGVYFTQYRPVTSLISSSTDNASQNDNGYSTNTIYWFSYDLIEWDILTESSGKALIIANLILDSQEYYPSDSQSQFTHNGGIGYANNYELSAIRKFLNDNFYNTAFNELQKALIETTTVDNSVASTGQSSNKYACNNTNEKMFLLSYKEATTYYTISTARLAKGSDYAKCQGLGVDSSNGNSFWWLRSPYYKGNCAYFVNIDDYGNYYYVYCTNCGVRPACWINL